MIKMLVLSLLAALISPSWANCEFKIQNRAIVFTKWKATKLGRNYIAYTDAERDSLIATAPSSHTLTSIDFFDVYPDTYTLDAAQEVTNNTGLENLKQVELDIDYYMTRRYCTIRMLEARDNYQTWMLIKNDFPNFDVSVGTTVAFQNYIRYLQRLKVANP